MYLLYSTLRCDKDLKSRAAPTLLKSIDFRKQWAFLVQWQASMQPHNEVPDISPPLPGGVLMTGVDFNNPQRAY